MTHQDQYATMDDMKDKRNHYPICVMAHKKQNLQFNTNDVAIRKVLKCTLEEKHREDPTVRIIDELGVNNGSARVDIAVVNGVLHGYEIKSDLDTLQRLPAQIEAYNTVFDKVTIVVGAHHIHEALGLVPDWWGVSLVRRNAKGDLYLSNIREADKNPSPDSVAIARLLWRDEALAILESINAARGVRTKTRSVIYERLATNLEQSALRKRVRETLFFRPNWRVEQKLQINGGSVQP
ncbi:MAG: sce7726 family protein [Candidatus Saccharimonadia bacterium]